MTAGAQPEGVTAEDVLREIGVAAHACETSIKFFGDDDPIPWTLLEMIRKTQQSINGGTTSLVFVIAMMRRSN